MLRGRPGSRRRVARGSQRLKKCARPHGRRRACRGESSALPAGGTGHVGYTLKRKIFYSVPTAAPVTCGVSGEGGSGAAVPGLPRLPPSCSPWLWFRPQTFPTLSDPPQAHPLLLYDREEPHEVERERARWQPGGSPVLRSPGSGTCVRPLSEGGTRAPRPAWGSSPTHLGCFQHQV